MLERDITVSPSPGGSPRRAAGALIVSVLVTALYWPELTTMVRIWWADPNYSHGFLVPIFSAFLLWRNRRALVALVPDGRWSGLLILTVGVLVFLVAETTSQAYPARISMVVVLAGLVIFLAGWAALRVVLFPLVFLVFMIPLPWMVVNELSVPLQGFASQVAGRVLDLFGTAAVVDGNLIRLPGLTLGVTEACSGIRALIALSTFATAWGYLRFHQAGPMAAMIVAAIPAALVANVARIVLTGVIGTSLGPLYAKGVFHELSGVIVFVLLAVGCLFGASLMIERIAGDRPALAGH